MSPSLGFIGLGVMGQSLARHLLEADPELAVYDVRPEATEQLVRQGAVACTSSADVARRASVVFASLPSSASVEETVLGRDGVLAGDAMTSFVDLSTTGAALAERLATRLEQEGRRYLDAPVSGGPTGAREGRLTVLAAGPTALFEELAPLLSRFGSNVFHIGERAGQGQLAKVINNLMSATAMAITGEALALGVKGGLDPGRLLAAINKSSGRNSASLDKYGQCVLTRSFDYGFRLRLMTKDVALCMAEAERLGTPMMLGSVVTELWNIANGKGRDEDDFTVIAKLFEEWAGVELESNGA